MTLTIIDIENDISRKGWFYFFFKAKESENLKCPGLSQEIIDYYKKNNQLPFPCSKCFKALIFWSGNFDEENIANLFKMLGSFDKGCHGKLNKITVVFYFWNKNQMLEFLEQLETKIPKFNVKGIPQWRRACKKFQELKPELWKNAKEFIPDSLT